MADFIQPNQQGQQDPDAIRKMILAKLMGGTSPADPNAPLVASPGFQPTDMTPAASPTPRPGASPAARPLSPPQSGSASLAPGGMTRSASISDPEATNAANHPLPTFQSEEEWNKANPAAPHTPYVAPDLKHRLLEGLFAGMQEFGRPGEGATTVRNYLGDIERKSEEEKHFPETSAATAHQKYMNYVQSQRQPLDLQELQARITDTQAQAKERAAKAAAEANPAPKTRLVQIADPTDPKNPIPATQDIATAKIMDQNGAVIPNAKIWEKAAPAGNDFEQYYAQWLKDTKQPDNAANRLAAHKQWEIKPEQPGANDTRLDRSYQYNNNIIEKQRTPVDQRLERLDRVEQAINQKSAQADALIAPELLSVMVGGMGSGLRMNEAEISRIVGGRSKLEDLKAVLEKWDPRTGGGLSVTDEQRRQMLDILKAVRAKTEAKQQAFDEAQEALIHAGDVGEHRKVTAELKKKLSAIDSGTTAAAGVKQAQPGALPPGWK